MKISAKEFNSEQISYQNLLNSWASIMDQYRQMEEDNDHLRAEIKNLNRTIQAQREELKKLQTEK